MKDSRERGATVVEFALIVPVLLLLILGLVEYGFRYQRASVLNNAAFVAARDLSVKKSTADAKAAAQAVGMPGAATFTSGSCTSGATNVTVIIKSTENSPTGAFFSQTFTVNAKGVARCES